MVQARQGLVQLIDSPVDITPELKKHQCQDVEDAVHLYTIFRESLSVPRLEEWVTRLDVEDEYERLERA